MTDMHHAELTIDLTVSDDRLDVRYRLRNTGAVPLGVFDPIRVPTIDGTLWYNPDAAYIDFVEGELHLQKVYLPIPREISAAEKPIPEVSRLDAGQSIDARLSLRLPVRVMNPYRRAILNASAPRGALVEAARAVKAAKLRFSIGSFPIEPAMRLTPVSPMVPGVFRVFPPAPGIQAQVIRSATATPPWPIPVLDYEAVGP